ncbi:hypothetical protein ST47_g9058 [Ascochyta rabiei]|uniref:Uncharacterized protein n=2 Tax=Didymella rabiei TaxID=5454 RepID=A0A162YAH0_DIDRA|nr:hypothetical protein ST47_g9058 [Ascochyta rabiei]
MNPTLPNVSRQVSPRRSQRPTMNVSMLHDQPLPDKTLSHTNPNLALSQPYPSCVVEQTASSPASESWSDDSHFLKVGLLCSPTDLAESSAGRVRDWLRATLENDSQDSDNDLDED